MSPTRTITIRTGHDMTEGWTEGYQAVDLDASLSKYRGNVERRIAAAYPDAAVEWDIQRASGVQTKVTSNTYGDEEIEDHVMEIVGQEASDLDGWLVERTDAEDAVR